MPKRFNITKEQFRSIRDDIQWEQFLRRLEIDAILGDFSKDHFDRALELGCGSGRASKHLANYCKKLIALEYNENLLTERSDDKVAFIVGDAQDLSRFGDNEMDLIFSNSLIEHLPNLDQCLRECGRVVKQDGFIVHVVPNCTWKIFNLLLYYPYGIKVLLARVFSKNKSYWTGGPRSAQTGLDSNLQPVSKKFSIRKNFLPKTHGISRTHISEFMSWGHKNWTKTFEKNGLNVINVVRLPFYFGWGYNFRFLIRLGNYIGLSSCTAYVLKKAGSR